MSYWFTGDTHFYHANIIKYCNRPFSSVEEMNEALISNWNERVCEHDTVYHLGDFAFGIKGGGAPRRKQLIEDLVRRLNGHIHLLYGNHDKKHASDASGFAWKGYYKEIKLRRPDHDKGTQKLVLFHYSQRVWNAGHHGAWQLYGHSHGTLSDDPRTLAFDVGVDCWDYRPIHFDEVAEQMKQYTFKPVDHHGAPDAEDLA